MAIISKQMRIEMGGASGILMSIFFAESGKIDEIKFKPHQSLIFLKKR